MSIRIRCRDPGSGSGIRDPGSGSGIRIQQKTWIRIRILIRIQRMRIRNTAVTNKDYKVALRLLGGTVTE